MKGRLSAEATRRDEAFRRLSQMTTAAAVGGTFAAVGFGALAAATYTGNSDKAQVDATAPVTNGQLGSGSTGSSSSGSSGGSSGNSSSGSTGSSGSSNSGSSGSTQRVTPTPAPQAQLQPVSPPTRSRGGGHVSTGGS